MAIQVDVSLSEESIQIAVEEILSRVQAKLAQVKQINSIGTIRKHPYQNLYAVWTGARWYVFFKDDENRPDVVLPEDCFASYNGLMIEQWSECRP